ncbi:MAG: L-seryl-tRNA(Sec) selenium transferase [Caldilinea sp.]|nr:L-seryl-tRNA(Sec) selenium transferase [Caldilinea sp.]
MREMITQPADRQSEYRKLPAVDVLLRLPAVALLAAEHGDAALTTGVRAVLAAARTAIAAGDPAPAADAWAALVLTHLAAADVPSLRPVINATGVIVHTNLGRAPLSPAALAAVQAVAAGYSSLEYDLAAGARGSRHDHARQLLRELTGAEDAMVVNNNAAAVFLVLSALCQGRGVLISRGQLVEIGGGFRIPDVLRQSGASLVEVGTTNRTHARDFAAAVTAETAAIMRVHSSNFKQVGFVTMPELDELAALAHGRGMLLVDDLGSGTLLDTAAYGLAPEPMVQQSVAAGADLITFSGDKLLGGPQAGLIVGRAELVERLRRHPMARALRVDKMTLAALEATLRSYRRGRAVDEIPVWQMIAAPADDLATRATRWQARLAEAGIAAQVQPGESAVGGGSLPGETLPTWLLAVDHAAPDAAAARLRRGSRPVVCRIQHDRLLFDPRTVLAEQEGPLLDALVVGLGNNA